MSSEIKAMYIKLYQSELKYLNNPLEKFPTLPTNGNIIERFSYLNINWSTYRFETKGYFKNVSKLHHIHFLAYFCYYLAHKSVIRYQSLNRMSYPLSQKLRLVYSFFSKIDLSGKLSKSVLPKILNVNDN